MSSKTKIVVLHMKEVIYTIIFIVLAIVLICLLVFMFGPGRKNRKTEETALYTPGVYTASLQLGGQTLDVQVAVDEDHINGVSFVNLDETVATMYPLLESSMDSISQQVCEDSLWNTFPTRRRINTQPRSLSMRWSRRWKRRRLQKTEKFPNEAV